MAICVVCFRVFVVIGAVASVLGQLPLWPYSYQQNLSTFAYVCNYSGYTDVSPNSIISKFGLVCFDWSNAKDLWANQQPMDCEERLVIQAAALKKTNPNARVMVYRNMVKALPWFSSVRQLLEDPMYAGFFLRFNTSSATHVPRCDSSYQPPRCSPFYHDQVQTPQYPNNSKYDGTCLAPCDCGTVPCGEYLFDHRNGSMLRDFLVNDFLLGPTGLGSGVIDGVSLDDGWTNATNPGSNACDGSPIGGPSEVSSFCAEDMSLTQQDTTALTAGWQDTMDAVHSAAATHGGYTWPQFTSLATPSPSECVSFFRSACTLGTYENVAVLHKFTEGPGRVFDPLPALEQDLATFLLLRGKYAWLGFDWNGCTFGATPSGGRHNQSFSFPEALNRDYGTPVDSCGETQPGVSGVFQRVWTRVNVTFDCSSWTSAIVPNV